MSGERLPVHFVGSIPLPSPSKTFTYLSSALPPGALKRIPDGEPPPRHNFVQWQTSIFPPQVLMQTWNPSTVRSFTQGEVAETMLSFPRSETKYDVEAVKSYGIFKELKEKGEIGENMKFQVCIPSPENFLGANIQPDFQPPIAPLYHHALITSIHSLQARIPHQDLSIQLDICMEFALLHKQWYEEFKAPITYIDREAPKDVLMGIFVEKIVSMAEAVEENVELGFHFCYGDAMNKHFIDPPDTAMIAELASAIVSKLKRSVTWIHFPVPKNRIDAEYLLPLKEMLVPKLGSEAELYAGLVHPYDLEGTKNRLAVARSVLGDGIGISSECGLGRKDKEWLDSVLEIENAIGR